jgi:hypothetical protein
MYWLECLPRSLEDFRPIGWIAAKDARRRRVMSVRRVRMASKASN